MTNSKSAVRAAADGLASGVVTAGIVCLVAGLVVFFKGGQLHVPWFFTAQRVTENGTQALEFNIAYPGVIAAALVCSAAALLIHRRSGRR